VNRVLRLLAEAQANPLGVMHISFNDSRFLEAKSKQIQAGRD
jgi:hypothetical protein